MLREVAATGVDLDSVYDQTLLRIKEQKSFRSRLGMEVLMWVSHAERPLRIDELCHALAVEKEATGFDPENVRSEDTVLGSCLGLVVVDKETSIVRLIHYTLQEYLSRPDVLPDVHGRLGQTCLTYLNYDEIKGLPTDGALNLESMPFLEYSSLHWGGHVKIGLSDYAKSLALELLNRYDSHISSVVLFDRVRPYWLTLRSHGQFSGLHCGSYFGIGEAMTALIQMEGCDINRGDRIGFTPLMWAARQGDQGAVELLLTLDNIDPNKQDNYNATPLWWASRSGHEGVVRLLLARSDVNPNKPDQHGLTPLGCASSNGHEGVVRLLLARGDVNPNKPDNFGQTPLWRACESGHEGAVRLPLARGDVISNKIDNDGETLLCCASRIGHEGVVKLLLALGDANPDKPDNDGETPLWWASKNGHEGVVRLLLARGDVNPNDPRMGGITPLEMACRFRHWQIVELLRSRTTSLSGID